MLRIAVRQINLTIIATCMGAGTVNADCGGACRSAYDRVVTDLRLEIDACSKHRPDCDQSWYAAMSAGGGPTHHVTAIVDDPLVSQLPECDSAIAETVFKKIIQQSGRGPIPVALMDRQRTQDVMPAGLRSAAAKPEGRRDCVGTMFWGQDWTTIGVGYKMKIDATIGKLSMEADWSDPIPMPRTFK